MKPKLIAIAVLAGVTIIPSIAYPNEALDRAEEACENYDWPQALAWFEVAAQAGDRRAQQLAGFMLLYGDRLYSGVQRDYERARTWLERAQAQGSEEAKYMLSRLERDPWLDPARLVASDRDRPQSR
jgi:TPR repeat protein